MLKIATAALLVLVSAAGTISMLNGESVSRTESAMTGASASMLSLDADSYSTNASDGNSTRDSALEVATAVTMPHLDLMTAGACAVLAGCCVLGLAMLRRHSQGGLPSLSSTFLDRVAFPPTGRPAQLAAPMRPSLMLLSVSRT